MIRESILAISGEFCSGKETLCKFLEENYKFFYFKINEENYSSDLNEEISKMKNLQIFESEENKFNSSSKDFQNIPSDKIIEKPKTLKKTLKALKHKLIVVSPFYNYTDFEDFSNKTPFKLIWVNSPAKIRFNNYKKKYNDINFENFLEKDYQINQIKKIRYLQENSFIQINNDSSLEDFKNKFTKLFTYLGDNIRPHWDDYFMSIAHIVSNRSNCIKQKVGALIVKNNRILSTGYNGTPSKIVNCLDGECPRCNSDVGQGEKLDSCFCIHAEENALLEIGKTMASNAVLYTTVYPCLLCSKLMIQCGITKVVYDREYNTEHTEYILAKGKIQVEKWKKNKAF